MEHKQEIPQWIKELQENSWELELIISGGAIFSLFQLADEFKEFVYALQTTTSISGNDLWLMIFLGMLGIKLLTLGFMAHLILRAFWIGLVCLNYVFPNGIEERKPFVRRPFRNNYAAGDNLYNQIQHVDQYAGLAMFLSIILTFLIFGFILSILITVTLPLLLLPFPVSSIYVVLVNFVYLLYVVDLLAFGLLRRIRFVSMVVYPIFWVLDRTTLRFAYDKALKVFGTNINRWKFSIVFTMALAATLLLTYSAIYQIMHWPNIIDSRDYRFNLTNYEKQIHYAKYLDQLEASGKKPLGPAIQSQIVSEGYLKLYMPYHKQYDESIQTADAIEYPADLIMLAINGKPISNPDWFNYYTPDNVQLGLVTMIDIQALPRGKHVLSISNTANKGQQETIVFWKDDE